MIANIKRNGWAYGIIALFSFFVILMVYFAFVAANNRESLVITDYYKAEIGFQQQIDKTENANALAEKPAINFSAAGNQFEVFFPKAIYADGVKGSIYFYRAENPAIDFEIALNVNSEGKQTIPAEKLKTGQWRLKMNWETNGQLYYIEQVITI